LTRTIRHTLVAGMFAAFVSGCAGGNIPGLPGMGSPSPTGTPSGATPTVADCTREAPAKFFVGTKAQGAYENQNLPLEGGWDMLKDEAAVTEAIKKQEASANWACFQKFYGGASTIYLRKKAATAPAASPSPAATK
jgi:hypothetical protein